MAKEKEKEVIENTEGKDQEEEEQEAAAQQEEEKTNAMIDEANAAAERIEDANKAMEKNLDRPERIKAQEILGGRAEAGGKEKTPEEVAEEAARNLIKGSGFEDMAFPPPEKKDDTDKKSVR